MIKFNKPICFYDLETTGLDIAKDRIVSISVIKLNPDGSQETRSSDVNPTIPIPAEAVAIHGITNERVLDKPTFKQLSKAIHTFMENCYIAGFNNNNYDNAVLSEEFARCGIEFPMPENKSIDVGNIFKKFEQRTLVAALKFYCKEDYKEDAHNSFHDTVATMKVFKAQMEKYEEFDGKDLDFVADFCKFDDRVDFAGKIGKDADGDYIFLFGNYKGQKVKDQPKYAQWIMDNDFTLDTKKHVDKALTQLKEQKQLSINLD